MVPHWVMYAVMQTVVETPTFVRQAAGLLSEEEREALIAFLARDPEAGDIIKGTGGVRKVRVATGGKGKSGGSRAIYFYADSGIPIYLLAVYGKGAQADLTPAQTKAVAAFAAAIKAQRRKS